MTDRIDTVVADTRRWLERAVIGLNLCPFAKSVHVKGQVHYAVSAATDGPALREDLLRELRDLAAIDPEVRDTTLLVAPDAFPDFLDFNDFPGHGRPRPGRARPRRHPPDCPVPPPLRVCRHAATTTSPTAPTARRTRRCT
jgi:hypothetical protein